MSAQTLLVPGDDGRPRSPADYYRYAVDARLALSGDKSIKWLLFTLKLAIEVFFLLF